jgi:hypothetical protein
VRIHKYPVFHGTRTPVELPVGAQILTIQVQGGQAQLWALADPAAERKEVIIASFATGEVIPAHGLRYIATCLYGSGHLVYHYFEELE